MEIILERYLDSGNSSVLNAVSHELGKFRTAVLYPGNPSYACDNLPLIFKIFNNQHESVVVNLFRESTL